MQMRKQMRKRTRTRRPGQTGKTAAWKNTLGQVWQDAQLIKGKLTAQQTSNYVLHGAR